MTIYFYKPSLTTSVGPCFIQLSTEHLTAVLIPSVGILRGPRCFFVCQCFSTVSQLKADKTGDNKGRPPLAVLGPGLPKSSEEGGMLEFMKVEQAPGSGRSQRLGRSGNPWGAGEL